MEYLYYEVPSLSRKEEAIEYIKDNCLLIMIYC